MRGRDRHFLVGLGVLLASCGRLAPDSAQAPGSSRPGTSEPGGSGSGGAEPVGSNPGTSDPSASVPSTEGICAGAPLQPHALVEGDYEDVHQLQGIVGNDIIYRTESGVWAVPIGGGAPTWVSPPSGISWVKVSRGAVAVWRAAAGTADNLLSVWTRKTGLVPMGSVTSFFFTATEDGSRVAFAETETETSRTLRVRNVADTNNSVQLPVARYGCSHSMDFAGTNFFAMVCSEGASAAKLVMVGANSADVVRMDAAADDAAPTLLPGPTWGPSRALHELGEGIVADRKGAKVFVRRLDSTGAIISVGTPNEITLLPDVAEGMMLPDGSAVICRTTGNELKKVTTADPAVTTTLAAQAKGMLRLSTDAKTVLFHKLDPVNERVDVNAVDHAAATPPVALLSTPMAWVGWTLQASATHALFRRGNSPDFTSMVPLAGGSLKDLPDRFFYLAGSTGVVTAPSCPGLAGCWDGYYLDVISGKTTTLASELDGTAVVTDNCLVYAGTLKSKPATSGIYVARLP